MRANGVGESDFERARIGDAEIAWTEQGPSRPDVGEGAPPLVLVHGFTGHRDDWREVLPVLAENRRIIALDLRGHGDSEVIPESSDYSFDRLVKDVVGLLDHLGIDTCDLLGHSVGGMVALRVALSHADRLRSLILMNTAPELPSALSREAWLKATEIAEARGMGFLQELSEKVGRHEADPILATWADRYWSHHRRRLCAMTAESYRGIGASLFEAPSLVSRLREIEIPCLVLVGDADHEFLPGADLFEASLAKMRRVTFPDCGHHPHQEARLAWLDAIESFLSGLPTAS